MGLLFVYFCTLFWISLYQVDTEIRLFALNSTKEKVLDRVQQQPLIPPKRFDIFAH